MQNQSILIWAQPLIRLTFCTLEILRRYVLILTVYKHSHSVHII
jgi:hypothetical protein